MKYIQLYPVIKWNFKCFIVSFLCVVTLFGCTTGIELIPLHYDAFLHDSNSKVWVVDQLWTQEGNHAQQDILKKDAIIFFEDGNCYILKVNALGTSNYDLFQYKLIEKDQQRYLRLVGKKKKLLFQLNQFSNGNIRLKPANVERFKYTMVLIPFPQY
jgi:hypothetical protein